MATPPPTKLTAQKARTFDLARAFDTSEKAARIYEQLRAGKDARSAVYNYNAEADDGADRDLLDWCGQLCSEGTFEISMQDMVFKTVDLPPMMQAMMPGQAISQKYKALIEKRPEWKKPLAEMIVDLMSTRLAQMANSKQSLLVSGDDTLFCADARFEAPKNDKSGFDRVVIGRFSLLDTNDPSSMVKKMPGLLMTTQKDKITDFFVAPRWKDHLALALASNSDLGERYDHRIEELAAAFEAADLPSSALLIRSVWLEQRGLTRVRISEQCLEQLARHIESGQRDARRSAVALGYWAQAVADPRERAKPETHAKVQSLLQQIARQSALYDATVLAFYLDESGFELPLPDPVAESPTRAKAQEILATIEQEKSPSIRLASYEDAAGTGDAVAMLSLAQAWEKGTVGHVNLVRAREWCEKAAAAGLPAAYNQLGVWSEFGIGDQSRKDPDRARAYYMHAANRGDAAGLCNAARVHQIFARRPIDPSIVVALYEGATRMHDPTAMNHLGALYYNGTIVPIDQIRAAKLWQEAAELDCAPAVLSLAFCHLRGQGVAADPVKALQLMQRAADAGLPAAKFHLGQMRLKGVGGSVDATEGTALIAAAAKLGYAPAIEFSRAQREAEEYASQMREMEQGSLMEQMSARWEQTRSDNFAARNDYIQWQVQQKQQAWRSQLGMRLGLPIFWYKR